MGVVEDECHFRDELRRVFNNPSDEIEVQSAHATPYRGNGYRLYLMLNDCVYQSIHTHLYIHEMA